MRLYRRLPAASLLALFACHDVESLKQCRGDGEILAPKGTSPASCVAPPSCRGLSESCGPTRSDNCCASAKVDTSEPFFIGYDEGGSSQGGNPILGFQAGEKRAVQLHEFWLDRFEVTIGRFRRFVDDYDAWRNLGPLHRAGKNPFRPDPTSPDGSPLADAWIVSWKDDHAWVAPNRTELLRRINDECGLVNGTLARGKWTDAPAADEDKPITCISWFEALMFCIWDGARLPSEAEWNYAAAGGAQQRAFPWSQPPSTTSTEGGLANLQGNTDLADVGSFPKGKGRFSHMDLAGNAYEWTMDSPASLDVYGTAVTDPIDVSGYEPLAPERIVRGGSFKFGPIFARTSYRRPLPADERYRDVGVRCARPSE